MASLGFNPDAFVKESKDYKEHTIEKVVAEVVEDTPKRKKKNEVVTGGSTSIAPANAPENTNLNFLQSDISYMTAYQETNEQLDSAIKELNMLGSEVMGELVKVKSSKTLMI